MVKALRAFVHLTNSQGGEMAVTLLVGGRTMSGMLTPNRRFLSWAKEVTLRAVHEKGQTKFPKIDMPSISKKEAEAIRTEWERVERETKEQDPDASSVSAEYEHLCLRNAQVFAPFAIKGSPPGAGPPTAGNPVSLS